MRTKTGISWIDAYVEQADREGVPLTIDRESGRELYSRILQQDVPMSIYRRLPIPTVVIHDRPRQRPEDIIAAAKQVFTEATVYCDPRSLSRIPDRKRVSKKPAPKTREREAVNA
jgi:hypothetical protein